MPPRTAIIGAGLAGLSCARALTSTGHLPIIFEKSRGFGGRIASRRAETPLGVVTFDHGPQFFTVRDDGFKALVGGWMEDGLAARWLDGGDEAYVGVPSMNTPFKTLAEGLDVRLETLVEGLTRVDGGWKIKAGGKGETFETIIVAIPAEQTAKLLRDPEAASDFAEIADGIPSLPCWTVMVVFKSRIDHSNVINQTGIVNSASRQGSNPGRAEEPEAWVIHTDGEWAKARIEEDAVKITSMVLDGFAEAVGAKLPEVVWARAHRWMYSRSGRGGREYLWDAERRIGVCGDWLIGPRVEAAYISGTSLAKEINGRSKL